MSAYKIKLMSRWSPTRIMFRSKYCGLPWVIRLYNEIQERTTDPYCTHDIKKCIWNQRTYLTALLRSLQTYTMISLSRSQTATEVAHYLTILCRVETKHHAAEGWWYITYSTCQEGPACADQKTWRCILKNAQSWRLQQLNTRTCLYNKTCVPCCLNRALVPWAVNAKLRINKRRALKYFQDICRTLSIYRYSGIGSENVSISWTQNIFWGLAWKAEVYSQYGGYQPAVSQSTIPTTLSQWTMIFKLIRLPWVKLRGQELLCCWTRFWTGGSTVGSKSIRLRRRQWNFCTILKEPKRRVRSDTRKS